MTRTLMGRIVRWVLVAGLVAFVLIQLVPVERTNPPVTSDVDAPDDVKAILRQACYDCHSHETHWPWYGRVAPFSWYLVSHVDHGRGDLNFSEWPAFDFGRQDLIFEDIREQLLSGEMPLRSYRLLHPEARLGDAERERLLRWAGHGP